MWPNDWTDTTDEHEMREREQDEADEAAFLLDAQAEPGSAEVLA